jgi:hypothetical protein
MRVPRFPPIALWMLLCPAAPALADVTVNFAAPGVGIGVDVPAYPVLERVPGYPVYYAPGVGTNYFFHDGLYWVYHGDTWYASSWYNGPWRAVDPYNVPVYLLRVPVRYYHHAPAYFRGWHGDESPRWGEHWGRSWEERRHGWNQWDHKAAYSYAPLPAYQRQYAGNRYPHASEQLVIEHRSYTYRPRDPVALQHYEHRQLEVKPTQTRAQRQMQQLPTSQPVQQKVLLHQQPQQQQQQHVARPQAPQQPQALKQPMPQPKPQPKPAQHEKEHKEHH